MNSQLVLQFRGAALETFGRLDHLEAEVTALLDPEESCDGLDVGAHGANLFVYTNHPEGLFARMRALLKNVESVEGFVVAARQVASDRFRVLWPTDSAAAFHLR